jgi:hypothetical protein
MRWLETPSAPDDKYLNDDDGYLAFFPASLDS